MSLSGRNFASASVPSGSAETRRLELRRQLAPGPQIAAMAPEHALEQAVELGHGRAERLDRDRAEIELLRRHDAARLGPERHLLQHRHRLLHMHEKQPAIAEVERRARRAVELEHVGLDQLELRHRLAARRSASAWAPSAPSISMPVTRPSGPTRSAISRITAPGPEPTSRQLMPGFEADPVEHFLGRPLPHHRLIAQALIFVTSRAWI